jgi:hypothetical protein
VVHRPEAGKRFRIGVAGAIAAALVTAFAVAAGIGFAGTSSTAADYQYGPQPGSPEPAISGTPQVGQTLTVSNGQWSGDQPITYTYQWLRCDAAGNNCVAIVGENSQTYLVQSPDVGHTLRVTVTATNAAGSASKQTNAVGPVTAGSGRASVSVSQVSLPQRLIVQQVKFTPNPVHGQRAIRIRVLVADTRGFVVRGALVFVRSTPLLTTTPPEQVTNANGYVTFKVFTKRGFPHTRGNVQFFVRARKAGEPLLAGVSSRRLVQVLTR